VQACGLGALEKITPGIPGIELTTLSRQGVSGPGERPGGFVRVVRFAQRCQPAALGLLTLTTPSSLISHLGCRTSLTAVSSDACSEYRRGHERHRTLGR
jgi:hypothetical protein